MRCERNIFIFISDSHHSSTALLLYATLHLLCYKMLPDSLSLNYTLWSLSQVWIIHEVKSGHCNQIPLLLHPMLRFFLCRTSSPSFSSLHCTFLLIPSWGNTTTEQALINTCADWAMKRPLCPEPATSHIPALPCTFKKLYLKTEHFHLPLSYKFCSDSWEFLPFYDALQLMRLWLR